MAQLVVRNVEESVKAGLRKRARRNGRSMEEEVRDILRDAVSREDAPTVGLGTEIAALMAKAGIDADFEIHELRGYPVKPESFDE